jgi:protein-L-isoaspartate(D-aspartate) O-methyltransferase
MWKTSIQEMLDTIRSEAKYTASYTGREQFSEQVMQAMHDVDRKHFVPAHYEIQAYDNGPLPIGHGQTISQPYIVALMTDLLDLTPESHVLEIGTGSGYQAAILSRLAKQVYSIERVSPLAETARQRLQELGYDNVEVRCEDGYYGWQDKAPFDAIIVTAAATHVPQSLIDQLKPGGRMIIPVGLQYMPQQLLLVTKDQSGETQTKFILDVAFVPLVTREVEDTTHHSEGET